MLSEIRTHYSDDFRAILNTTFAKWSIVSCKALHSVGVSSFVFIAGRRFPLPAVLASPMVGRSDEKCACRFDG